MTRQRAVQRGVTLIELMVAMIIALVTSIAVFQLMSGFEAQRRRTVSGSDSSQQGAMAAYVLERLVRQAGAGMAQGSRVWGCRLVAVRAGNQILPRGAPWPAPFEAMPQELHAAPTLAFPGGADAADTLLVAYGSAPGPNVPIRFTSISPANPRDVYLTSTVGVNQGRALASPAASRDLSLVFNDAGSFGGNCEFQRIESVPTVDSTGTAVLGNPVRFSMVGDIGRPMQEAGFFGTASMLNMGAQPALTWIGIRRRPDGSGSDLVMHDALERDGAQPIVVADNVVDMRVLYGVDDGSAGGTANDHRVDAWVRPEGTSWAPTVLNAGSAFAAEKLGQVQALRLGIVVRSVYRERDAAAGGPAQVGPAAVTLFADTPAVAYTRTFAPGTEESRYRHAAFEITVPLRNLVYRRAGP